MSGDVKVQTEKEYGPPPRSSIGEPRKKLYRFPHLLFPYRSRYKSPNRQRWWPGSTPRFPVHTHPKRWAPLQELSVAFFAFHAKKSTPERNLYELMHTVPLRGAGSFFWRDGSQDAWKYEGRKANRVRARGVRTPEAGGQWGQAAAEERHGNAASGDIDGGNGEGGGTAGEGSRWRGSEREAAAAGHTRKQFVFSPREIFFKYRPFKALVFGRLTIGLVCVPRHAYGSSSHGFSGGGSNVDGEESGSSSDRYRMILSGRGDMLPAANSHACRTAAVIQGRARVAPPQANLGGWKWQPPPGASRWIFRPAFPTPLSATS